MQVPRPWIWQPGDLMKTHGFPSLPHGKFGFIKTYISANGQNSLAIFSIPASFLSYIPLIADTCAVDMLHPAKAEVTGESV